VGPSGFSMQMLLARESAIELAHARRRHMVLAVQQRFEAASKAYESMPLSDHWAPEAARSRLAVVSELLHWDDRLKSDDLRDYNYVARRVKALNQMLDGVDVVLHHRGNAPAEQFRAACLDAARRTRLPDDLDPDFLSRVMQVDQWSSADLARALVGAQHPLKDLRPRFSCWKEPPLRNEVPLFAVSERLSDCSHALSIWNRMKAAGAHETMYLSLMLAHAQEATTQDVDALVDQLLKAPPALLDVLSGGDVKMLVVRAGSESAKRLFANGDVSQQVAYHPPSGTLVVATQSQDGQLQIPSATVAGKNGAPPRFWIELGRQLMTKCLAPYVDESEPPVEEESWDPRDTRAVRQCALQLSPEGFLAALVSDMSEGKLPIPLAASQDDMRASLMALLLLRRELPPALSAYFQRWIKTGEAIDV
jgi:hypothetical protein